MIVEIDNGKQCKLRRVGVADRLSVELKDVDLDGSMVKCRALRIVRRRRWEIGEVGAPALRMLAALLAFSSVEGAPRLLRETVASSIPVSTSMEPFLGDRGTGGEGR